MRDETKIFDGFNLQDANTVNMQSTLSKTSQMIGQTVTGRKCTSPDCFWCHRRRAYSSAQTFIRLKISRDTAWWGTYGRSGIISRFKTTWLCGPWQDFTILYSMPFKDRDWIHCWTEEHWIQHWMAHGRRHEKSPRKRTSALRCRIYSRRSFLAESELTWGLRDGG